VHGVLHICLFQSIVDWMVTALKIVLSFYFHLCYVTNYAVDALLLSYCISLNFCILVILLFTVHCSFSCKTANSLNDCCVNFYVFINVAIWCM